MSIDRPASISPKAWSSESMIRKSRTLRGDSLSHETKRASSPGIGAAQGLEPGGGLLGVQ